MAFRFGQALLLNNIRFFDKFFDTGYRMYCGRLWFPLNGISALKHGICIRSTIASKTLDRHWISDANTVFRFFSDLMWDAGLPELPTHCFFTDTLTMFDLF